MIRAKMGTVMRRCVQDEVNQESEQDEVDVDSTGRPLAWTRKSGNMWHILHKFSI